jgi:hypothetical protein
MICNIINDTNVCENFQNLTLGEVIKFKYVKNILWDVEQSFNKYKNIKSNRKFFNIINFKNLKRHVIISYNIFE